MRIGAYVDCGQVISAVVCIVVQTNVARDAYRAGAVVSQYMTSAQPNLLWSSSLCGPGIWRKSGKAVNGGVEVLGVPCLSGPRWPGRHLEILTAAQGTWLPPRGVI